MCDETDVQSVNIIIDPEANRNAEISLCIDEVIFDFGREHPFFEYIKNADYLRFSKSKHDGLKIEYGVHDVWEESV